MPLPEFTPDEQYLINSVKSHKSLGTSNSYMWGYLTGGVLLCAFAAYYDNTAMLVAAFLVVCGFRIYEDRWQSKWMPLWRSIIDKYEAAAGCEPGPPEATPSTDRPS